MPTGRNKWGGTVQPSDSSVTSLRDLSEEISDDQLVAQLRKRFAATFQLNARLYWLDLLLSSLLGWIAFWLSVQQ